MLVDINFCKYVEFLKRSVDVDAETVFFCIGTDRVIGDSLGPITGTLIKQKYNDLNVYGELDETVTYENIRAKLDEINQKFNNPYIVAIDAALSTAENVGKIFIDNQGINFGESLGKNIGNIGNIGIKVVVGVDYNDAILNFKTLQNTNMSEIIKLSKKTFEGISILMNK